MNVDFFHYPEANALIEVITGKVTLEGLIEMKKTEQARDYLNHTVRILSVFLDADFALSLADVRALTAWQKEHNQRQIGAKTAHLASKPVATALNMLYSKESESIRVMKVFSTLWAALDWLELDPEMIQMGWPAAKRLI
jgi:hypothetical protein